MLESQTQAQYGGLFQWQNVEAKVLVSMLLLPATV